MTDEDFEDGLGKAYRLTSDENAGHHPAGTVCYAFMERDYGEARYDTKKQGEHYISMTLDANGSGTFFTVPRRCLVEIRPGEESDREAKTNE